MSEPFFIGAYPRSRTAWVCNYFTAHGYLCLHEPLLQTRSIEETLDLVETLGCGICDSTVPMMLPQIRKRFPDAPTAFIDRNDWVKSPAVSGVTQDRIDRMKSRVNWISYDIWFSFKGLDQNIDDLASHCIPGFKKNPLIHAQCLRFNVQLTEKALKEALTTWEFTVERKEAA